MKLPTFPIPQSSEMISAKLTNPLKLNREIQKVTKLIRTLCPALLDFSLFFLLLSPATKTGNVLESVETHCLSWMFKCCNSD
ncbi:hypothetical protein H6P81_003223 [Aristolochia fimbriata]|uniref:Uncharacterized protein n=1 Tax=Aristolochia fimbriata TaxID=158543 RepID=A0AAV7FBZ6_ARIFI|nr:hypothetical protein H6P81_003223 [Aristolochia fimbriata]